MKHIYLSVILLMLAMVLVGCSSNEIEVEDVWARPGISGGNSAVYFLVNNPTEEADNLLNAHSDVAEHIELHLSKMKDDGTMTMLQQESVPIPANSSIEFKPGGLHVMLINLIDGLKPGDTFNLSLNFENAGEITVEVTVREP